MSAIKGARWNGEPAKAWAGTAIVGESPASTWWCAGLVGQRRACVKVEAPNGAFYLDNEDGSGTSKVKAGGGPRSYHRSLPVVEGSFEVATINSGAKPIVCPICRISVNALVVAGREEAVALRAQAASIGRTANSAETMRQLAFLQHMLYAHRAVEMVELVRRPASVAANWSCCCGYAGQCYAVVLHLLYLAEAGELEDHLTLHILAGA